jgi:hypothetical protein
VSTHSAVAPPPPPPPPLAAAHGQPLLAASHRLPGHPAVPLPLPPADTILTVSSSRRRSMRRRQRQMLLPLVGGRRRHAPWTQMSC